MPFLHNDHKRREVLWRIAVREAKRNKVTRQYNEDQLYIGEWKDDLRHGKGRLISSTKRYEGDFVHDYPEGYGIHADVTKSKINLRHTGSWRKGIANGYGNHHYENGDFCEGMFKNGKKHGWNWVYYADGSFYGGEFIRDCRNGEGIFIQPNGNRYEGFWFEDQKHGFGRFYHLDKGTLQEGVWVNGICRVSTITCIPYRQSAIDPMPYPIPGVGLVDADLLEKLKPSILEKLI